MRKGKQRRRGRWSGGRKRREIPEKTASGAPAQSCRQKRLRLCTALPYGTLIEHGGHGFRKKRSRWTGVRWPSLLLQLRPQGWGHTLERQSCREIVLDCLPPKKYSPRLSETQLFCYSQLELILPERDIFQIHHGCLNKLKFENRRPDDYHYTWWELIGSFFQLYFKTQKQFVVQTIWRYFSKQ